MKLFYLIGIPMITLVIFSGCSNVLVKYGTKSKGDIEGRLNRIGKVMSSNELAIDFKIDNCDLLIKYGEEEILLDLSKVDYQSLSLFPLKEYVRIPCLDGGECIKLVNDDIITYSNSYSFYSYNLEYWQSQRALREILDCFAALGYQCEDYTNTQ